MQLKKTQKKLKAQVCFSVIFMFMTFKSFSVFSGLCQLCALKKMANSQASVAGFPSQFAHFLLNVLAIRFRCTRLQFCLTFHLSLLTELKEKHINAYINGQVFCLNESLKESRPFMNVQGNRLVQALSKHNGLSAGRYNRKTGQPQFCPLPCFCIILNLKLIPRMSNIPIFKYKYKNMS